MLQLQNIEKVYRTDTLETVALANINLHVKKGEFISIMGPSGSGKSTLLNIMGLLDAASSGRVLVDGQEVTTWKDKTLAELRNRQLGFIFQKFHLIPDLRAVDNVEIPLLYRKLSGSQRRKMAQEALERVGLSSRAQHFPGQLSGGQQQRVAIARAIVGNPGVVMADEPTGNLDSQMSEEIMQILKDLNHNQHTTIVMVTHDKRMADMTDRIVRIFDGRQVSAEIPAQVF